MFDAFKDVNPEPLPEKDVADKAPVDGLNVRVVVFPIPSVFSVLPVDPANNTSNDPSVVTGDCLTFSSVNIAFAGTVAFNEYVQAIGLPVVPEKNTGLVSEPIPAVGRSDNLAAEFATPPTLEEPAYLCV